MENRPKTMSNMMQTVLFIVIGGISVALLSFLNVPKSVVLVLVLLASTLTFTVYPMFLIYKSNSLPAIEKYIIRNRKKAFFSYAYALAYGREEDIENALQLILKKHKQKEMQTIYQANLALHQKDHQKLLQLANEMTKSDYQPYYSGLAYVLNDQLKEAKKYVDEIQTPWMLHSLQASIAFHENDVDTFESEKEKAIENARGIQKYSIYHRFEKLPGKL